MKFVDGLMIHSGDPMNDYVDAACRHVLLRQGVLGIKVCWFVIKMYKCGLKLCYDVLRVFYSIHRLGFFVSNFNLNH